MANSLSDGTTTFSFGGESDFQLTRKHSYKTEETELAAGANVSENRGRNMTVYRMTGLFTNEGETTPVQKADSLEELFSDCDALTLTSTAFLTGTKSVYIHTYDVSPHEEARAADALVFEIEAIEAR